MTVEQFPPPNCFCTPASNPSGRNCNSRGCSAGDNKVCSNASVPFSAGFYVMIAFDQDYPGFVGRMGCNCPNSSVTIFRNGVFFHNAYYDYHYTTCTDFGRRAHDANDTRPGGDNPAIDCCNFCCDRNDPYPPTTTTTTTKSSTTVL